MPKMASRNNREAYFDELMQRDCEEPNDGDMVFPIDHDGGVLDDNEEDNEDDDAADMVFEMDDPDFDEPHSEVSGATPTNYNVFNFHSRSMSHSLSSVGGGMRLRPTPPRQPHSRSRSSFSAASATRPTLQQRPALQASQIFPLSAPASRRPLVVPFSPSQYVVPVTGGRDTFMGFHQGDGADDGDDSHVYFDTPAFASASARAHELQQAQYYAVQTQTQSSPGPMTIPSPSSHSASPRQHHQQLLQSSQPHHVPGQLHPHHPQHSRYYHTGEAETLARQSLESASHPVRPATTTRDHQPPFVGHEAQAYWSANMVLSTTESVGIDPAELVNPCFSLPPLVSSCQTPVADRSTPAAMQNQRAWKVQQEQQAAVKADHQKNVEQQAAAIQHQQELLVVQRCDAQLQHLAQIKENEQARCEKEEEERRKKEALGAQQQQEAQGPSTSVCLYESFLALRAVLETEQRRQKKPQAPHPVTTRQAPLQVTLHAGMQQARETLNPHGDGSNRDQASQSRSGLLRSAPPSASPFVPLPPDNVPLPALPHNFPHPPRRSPVVRPPRAPTSSSVVTPPPLAALFIPSRPSQPAQPVIAYGSKPYRGSYVPVADQNQNRHSNKADLYYQYQHYTYQPVQSKPQQASDVPPQTQPSRPSQPAHDTPALSTQPSNVTNTQQEQIQAQEGEHLEQPLPPPPLASPLVVCRQLKAASSHRTTMYTQYAPYDSSARPRRRRTGPSNRNIQRTLHPRRNPRALRAAHSIRPFFVGSRGQSSTVQRPVHDQSLEEEEPPHDDHHEFYSSSSHDAPSPEPSISSPMSTSSSSSTMSTVSTPPSSAASSMPSPSVGGATAIQLKMQMQMQGAWASTMSTHALEAIDGGGDGHGVSTSSSGQISITNSALLLKPTLAPAPTPSFSRFPMKDHHSPLAIPDTRSREGRRLADKASLAMTPIVLLPLQKQLLLTDEWSSHPSATSAINHEAGDATVTVTSLAEPLSHQVEVDTMVGGDDGPQAEPVGPSVEHVNTADTQPQSTHAAAHAATVAPPVVSIQPSTFDHHPFTPGEVTLLRMPPSLWVALFQFAAHQAYVHHCRLTAHLEARRQAWKRSVPPSRPWRWTWLCLCRRRHVVLLLRPRSMGGPQWCDRCGQVEPERGEDEYDDVDDDVGSVGRVGSADSDDEVESGDDVEW